MNRPAWVQPGHTFGPADPDWLLLAAGFKPLCDVCNRPADQPHTDTPAPTRYVREAPPEPGERRYWGD